MRLSLVIGLLLIGFTQSIHAADKPATSLKAGAVKININPRQYPVSMTGSFQDRLAKEAHDPLHARALVLSDGTTQLAIVICDSCLISRDIYDAAKKIASDKTGIPKAHMLTAATHTHTAPTAVPLAQCNPSPAYVEQLTQSIAQSIIEAHAKLAAAKVAWTVTDEPNEVNNRRWFVKEGNIRPNPFGETTDRVRTNAPRGSDILLKPAGPIDPQVAILSVQHADGRPLALLANYSLHYVGGIPAGLLSADYFGEYARQIKKRLGGDTNFVGMMSNGTSGDINNYNFRKPRPAAAHFERVVAVAKVIADRTYAAVKNLKHNEHVKLQMLERTIALGIRKPTAAELKRAKDMLAKAKDPKRLTMNEVYAQESLRLHQQPDRVNIKLQAIRIGELAILANPCETFVEIGLHLKKQSPFKPTFTIGLANGYNGYLPTPAQHELQGYETWRSSWSYLANDASVTMSKQLLDMAQQLAD